MYSQQLSFAIAPCARRESRKISPASNSQDWASGNNLHVNVEKLLNVAGHITSVRLHDLKIEMQFALQPCRQATLPVLLVNYLQGAARFAIDVNRDFARDY